MNDLDMDESIFTAAASGLPVSAPKGLDAAFRSRAEAEGLVDVAYDSFDTPCGPMLAAVTDAGLVRLSYQLEDGNAALEEMASRLSPRLLEMPGRVAPFKRELLDYLAGRRRGFDFPVDWTLIRGFGRRVLEATYAIPFGSHLTYTEVATAAGSPRGSRAAGNALGANPIPIVIPCHRVLHKGGGLGGYTGGLDKKRFLLRLEGVQVR